MAEYMKHANIMSRDGGARGLGIAGTIAGGLALLGNANSGGGLLPNLFGNNQQAATTTAAETMLLAPIVAQAYAGSYGGYGHGHGCDPDCRPITKEVLKLTAESAAKDATIAQLQAKGYTDEAIRIYDRTEVEPLKMRVCELETAQAVNAARDRDYRRYVEREFVHQPKARMKSRIVTCEDDCCCCCDDRDDRDGRD